MPDSSFYERLATTAKDFVLAPNDTDEGNGKVEPERVLDTLAPDAHIRWGHDLFVSTKPPLQGEKSRRGFMEHMRKMAPSLQSCNTVITATNVDVDKRSVVLRAKFTMLVKDHDQEPVVNDILFWIVMNEAGDQVVDVTEFVDPVATGEIAKKVQEYKDKSENKK